VRLLNRITASTLTVERLRRTVRRLVSEGIIEAKLLDRAPRQPGDDRLIRLVAGIAAAAPDRTLQQIAAQLEGMRERTPRGGTRWHPSSVKHLLTRAEQLGVAGTSTTDLGECAPDGQRTRVESRGGHQAASARG
jgi:hypothetical protein